MNIDIHSHFIPKEYIKLVKNNKLYLKAEVMKENGLEYIKHDQGYCYPLCESFYDIDYRIKEMAQKDIDKAAISAAPPLFYYDANESIACEVVRLVNDSIYNVIKLYPDRFIGIANIPLQFVNKAIEELEYIKNKLGFNAVHIGSNIEGKQLDSSDLLPFFAKAEELEVLIFVHPYYIGEKNSMEKYYLTNLIGNPMDTTMTIAHLVFGGVMDKFPNLRFCFAHGGGFFPYQIGRFIHGFKVRKEPKVNCVKEPDSYLKQMYFDTILFDIKALEFLVSIVGGSHVMMGTDYPFDMGELNPIKFIESSIKDIGIQRDILENNATKIFKVVNN